MKLPLKSILINNYHESNLIEYSILKEAINDLIKNNNEVIDYIEQLEERIRDLEKNELY